MLGVVGPVPVALDHNFPEPLVLSVAEFLPEVRFHWLREIRADLPNLDDHDMVYEVHRAGFTTLISCDYNMVNDQRVLVAAEQTRMSLLLVQSAGHDPVLATGVLFRDLLPILRRGSTRGEIYLAHSSRIRPRRAREMLAVQLDGDEAEVSDVIRRKARPFEERRQYPVGDERRVAFGPRSLR